MVWKVPVMPGWSKIVGEKVDESDTCTSYEAAVATEPQVKFGDQRLARPSVGR